MAASAEIIIKPLASAISLRWIISARDDLVWFMGSVISSYALLFLYVKGLVPLIPMMALWAILIDAPHVFATFSRTYFDRTERATRRRLLWGSLLFFALGPLLVLAGAGFAFFFVAALWAYYHLVKQHYGFMVLYKKKNNDLAPVDNALDRWLLMFAFNYPFVAFIANDPSAMARVPPLLRSGVNTLAMLLLAGTIVVGGCWLIRQVQRAWLHESLNLPKYLLLAAAIPMHWIALLTPMPNKPIALVAILTIYHNLQYHRLIWFHNQKYMERGHPVRIEGAARTALRGISPTPASPVGQPGWGGAVREGSVAQEDLKKKYGAASLISRRLLYYIAFGILFGLLYQGPRQLLGYFGLKASHGDVTAQLPIPIQLGVAVLWGVAFIHYYLDSKIWRVRRDPSVGEALKMS